MVDVTKKLITGAKEGVLEARLMCGEFEAGKLVEGMMKSLKIGEKELRQVRVKRSEISSDMNQQQDLQWRTLADELILRLAKRIPSIADRLPGIIEPLIDRFRRMRLVLHDRATASAMEFETSVVGATEAVAEHQTLVKELDKGAGKLRDLAELERRASRELIEWEDQIEKVILRLVLVR